jgi:hypothetical protein
VELETGMITWPGRSGVDEIVVVLDLVKSEA